MGHFGIPKLLVFLWRLTSFGIGANLTTPGTPVAVTGCPGQFVFDPTGREIPLFLPPPPPLPDNFADTWTASYEWQVPGPITASLEHAVAATGSTAPPSPPYPYPPPASPPSSSPPTATPVPFGYAVTGAIVERVWPERGRFQVHPSEPAPVSAARNNCSSLPTASRRPGRRTVQPRCCWGDPPAARRRRSPDRDAVARSGHGAGPARRPPRRR